MKHKRNFILTYENLLEITTQLEKENNIKIEIQKSNRKNSNSFYLRLYKKEVNCIMRISDHNTKEIEAGNGRMKNLIISNSVGPKVVKQTIQGKINTLNYKYKMYILNKIKGE